MAYVHSFVFSDPSLKQDNSMYVQYSVNSYCIYVPYNLDTYVGYCKHSPIAVCSTYCTLHKYSIYVCSCGMTSDVLYDIIYSVTQLPLPNHEYVYVI